MAACLQAVALAPPLSPPIVVGHRSPRTRLTPAAAWTHRTPTDRAPHSHHAWAPPSHRTPATLADSPRPPTSLARTPRQPSRLGGMRASSRTPTTAAMSTTMSTTLQLQQCQRPQPPSAAPQTSHLEQLAAVGAAVALPSSLNHRIRPHLPTLHHLPKQPLLPDSSPLSLHTRPQYPPFLHPQRSQLPQPPLGLVTAGSSGGRLHPHPCHPLSPWPRRSPERPLARHPLTPTAWSWVAGPPLAGVLNPVTAQVHLHWSPRLQGQRSPTTAWIHVLKCCLRSSAPSYPSYGSRTRTPSCKWKGAPSPPLPPSSPHLPPLAPIPSLASVVPRHPPHAPPAQAWRTSVQRHCLTLTRTMSWTCAWGLGPHLSQVPRILSVF
jgi:hypothetical protein